MYINELAHIDVPTSEYPCVVFIQKILYSLDVRAEKEASLPAFVEFVGTELQITKSAYWCYEKEVFERLIAISEAYLLVHADQLSELAVDMITESITLLKFLAENHSNLDVIPKGYEDFDQRFTCYFEDVERRVDRKFRDPMIKCLACENEFSQIESKVVRTLHAIRCPNCQQSFSL